LSKDIEEYIKISIRLLSIMNLKKFINSFLINIDNNCKILAENYKALDTERLSPLVDRKKIKNPNNWAEILNEAELMDSLLFKVLP